MPTASAFRRSRTSPPVGPDEGLPRPSVASFDSLRPVPKSLLVRRLGAVAPEREHLLCAVATATLDC